MSPTPPRETSPLELKALRQIRNFLVHFGRPPSVRELAAALKYKSPRSAAVLIERLIELGFLERQDGGRLQLRRVMPEDEQHAQTVEVPLIGIASCGAPILAEGNVDALIPVSTRLARPPHRHFLLRAAGDSMTEVGIADGSLVLVRQQAAAKEGDMVVALIDGEATIKEFRRSGDVVTLLPRSKNKAHMPIILTRDFMVQGVVVATLPEGIA